MDTSPRDVAAQKNPIEALSKDEIISKYKGLLNIAKKAKQAKDDLTEENRQLKEALSHAAAKQSTLPAMQEMVQDFTDKNLILTEQLNSLQRKTKDDTERLAQLEIENESLRRQLARLSDENDGLLTDIERMEQAMQQVNELGNEQRKNLELLEVDIVKIKEAETENATLRSQLLIATEESQLHVQELQDLHQKYQHVKELNSEQRKKFNTLKDRFIDVHRKLKNLKECKCVLLETQHEYAASVSKWQQEIVKASQLLFAKITALQQENEALRGQQNENCFNRPRLLQLVNELERLGNVVKAEQLKLQVNEEQPSQQKQQLIDLHRLFEKLDRIDHLTEVIKQERSHQLLTDQRLQQEQEDLKAQMHSNAAKQAERQSRTHHKENVELLAQLEASQATVAKLQEEMHIKAHQSDKTQELADQLAQVKALQDALHAVQEHNENLQSRFQQKEHEHAELLAEMRELNEALKARGDVISRLQEQSVAEAKNVAAKQKELEAKLETKAQTLQEKSQQLEVLQTKVAELEQELQQYTNGDGQSDVMSTSTISRAEELNRLRELDDGYEEKYNKLRTIAAKLKKKLQEQTHQISEMDQQAASSEALRSELDSIKLAQVQLQQDLNAARAENQKIKSKGKNSNVLNLEIEAAEKSLADVSAKLLTKSAELEVLNEALTSKESTIVQLRKELSILEAAKDSEVTHAKQLKEQMDRMQTQVKDAVHSQQQALTLNKELEHNVEKHKLEVEELRLQLATTTQKHEAMQEQSKHTIASTAQELQSRIDAIAALEAALRTAERAHEELRIEHLDYKVKAQAVLRNHQSKGSDKEYELEAEVTTLRANEQKLQASNEEQSAEVAKLTKQRELLQEDNFNLQKRNSELMSIVEELRQQSESLAQDHQRQMQQQQQRLQQQRQQLDQLDSTHKLQLLQLQQQLEQAQLAAQSATLANPTAAAAAVASHSCNTEPSKIDYTLMDQDATQTGEFGGDVLAQLAAQRKISTASRRSHDFMPLDELLNTSLHAITSDTVTTITNFGRSVSMQQDDAELDLAALQQSQAALQSTKERLNIQESRVRHLTALLAENEQDLAKLTQMNDMLKEELRRQERSEEREQHMHNSEYLKNVFLKFLTLNNGDERQRLVPVLNTILRLSRSETEMLSCVAKGQKVSNEGSNRSWTGFLSAWSGGATASGGSGNNSNNNNN